jgi:hypothetical protein
MGRTFLERLARFGELPKVPACILVLLLLGGSWAVSYHTGGTKHAYPHLFYVPILLGAFFFRVPGALLTAAAAGILSGPLMPLDVEAGIAQPLGLWLFRMGFFAFIGLLTAVLFSQLDRRLAEVNRLVSALAQHHVRTLIVFAQLHEQRDKSTEGHSQRVAINALRIGQRMGLKGEEINTLYWAGLLHDLGKILVPDGILLKNGPLTAEEFLEIQKHPGFGAETLESISDGFRAVAEGIRSHHERWDGRGYPAGLKGKDIPLAGRIIAVADVFEALTNDRSYRVALPVDLALAYIQREAGVQFDPEVVETFVELHRDGKISVSLHPGDIFESLEEASRRFPGKVR